MFISMVLEAVIIIIPSELILATSGILVSNNIFTFMGAFITGLLGSVFCAIVIYLIGYFGGMVFIDKYGKYFFMKKIDIEKSNQWFNKYGLISACLGRNFPIIRTLISLPIGIFRMNFFKFVLYTLIGSIPWTFAFVYVGYALGNNWTILSNIMDKIKGPIIIFIIGIIFFFIYKKTRHYLRV
ncbi:MAG: DedA family protein [Bacilli bacterium]